MANMRDAARAMAAEGLTGMGGMPMEMPPAEEAGAETPGAEAPDVESALAGLEAALADLSPDIASEVRSHIEAIRQLTVGGEAAAAPPDTEGGEASALPELPTEA